MFTDERLLHNTVVPSSDDALDVSIRRYNVRRLRLIQTLTPLFVVLSILTRRFVEDQAVMLVVAFALLLLIVGLLTVSMRLRGQRLIRRGRHLELGNDEARIQRDEVSSWTLTGRSARLYCGNVSYRLKATRGQEAALAANLHQALGSPVELHRRGSKRARTIAGITAAVGVVSLVVGLVYGIMILFALGFLGSILGLSTVAALSQRVAKP